MNTTIRLSFVAVATVIAVMACDTVPLTSPTGSTISLSIDRNILPLNGQATVRAVVTESAGTPVHNGTIVTFQPSIGTTNPVEAPTVNGIATTTFVAGSISGTGFIHAFSGPARTGSGNASSGGVEVRIGSAAAGRMSVSASPSSVSQSGGTVTISALVTDGSDNPLSGVSVLFSTTAGSLNSSSAISDANGIARTTLTTSQTARVTATAGTANGAVDVAVSAAPNVTLEVPTTGIVGVPVPMSITPQSGGSGNTSPRQLATVVVNFGDGQAQTFTNITGTTGFTHTYDRPNGYTVSATATDVVGNTGNTSKAIVITRSTPGATVSATPSSGAAPLNSVITVGATASAGAPSIESVRVTVNGNTVFTSTSGGTFAYRFDTPGNYVIEAFVTDAAGTVGRATNVVVVN
jgi:adhesin/invasin